MAGLIRPALLKLLAGAAAEKEFDIRHANILAVDDFPGNRRVMRQLHLAAVARPLRLPDHNIGDHDMLFVARLIDGDVIRAVRQIKAFIQAVAQLHAFRHVVRAGDELHVRFRQAAPGHVHHAQADEIRRKLKCSQIFRREFRHWLFFQIYRRGDLVFFAAGRAFPED